MSAKWRRSLAWDDEFFPAWAWPVKATLRAFSSIRLAVTLLVSVALFGVLASVPIGLLALIPTYAVYALAFLVVAGVPALLALIVARLVLRNAGLLGWMVGVVSALGVGALGAWTWLNVDAVVTWPALRYDAVHETGLRLFPAFVATYADTTLRRLPGFEMTELEFYSWWPMRVLLGAFVINMITATLRRIEFTFKNLGVLTVHTGIVIMSIGSLYYAGLKQEGDLFLQAGLPDPNTGAPSDGPPVGLFYDINRVALHVSQADRFEQWPVALPRYNAYALDAAPAAPTAWEATRRPVPDPERDLDRAIRRPDESRVDERLSFRLVGYAPYAEAQTDHARVDLSRVGSIAPGDALRPLRIVELLRYDAAEAPGADDQPVFSFWFLPRDPVRRLAENAAFAIELHDRIDAVRWQTLTAPIPQNAPYGLVIRVPAVDKIVVMPALPGMTTEVAGYQLELQSVSPEPPFPIVTEGYRGATCSVAIVRVEAPDGEVFERYVYQRFPEINQDLVQGDPRADGRPQRRDADPAIDIALLDDTKIQIIVEDNDLSEPRAIVRAPGREPRVIAMDNDRLVDIVDDPTPGAPRLDLRIAERWEHSHPFERPIPVPEIEQDPEMVGTHRKAMAAIEVTMQEGDGEAWRQLVWTPFNPFPDRAEEAAREVRLPDGRRLRLSVGPVIHRFRDFRVSLVDFEMLAYDHRGAPRDYQSTLRVAPRRGIAADGSLKPAAFETYTHVAKLNSPLRAPFMPREDANVIANTIAQLLAGFSPDQYKLSQAGWDRDGWQRTQAQADRGEISRPFAQFTILRVGNNPGIYVIALGSVLVALGTPWAFYVKPWLVRRERERLKRAHTGASKQSRPSRVIEEQPEPVGAAG